VTYVNTVAEDLTGWSRKEAADRPGAVMVFRDVTAARALSLKMSHLAQHDSPTHLPNRILLNDRLNQEMAMADRSAALPAVRNQIQVGRDCTHVDNTPRSDLFGQFVVYATP
jgi:hypothetical protein